MIYDANLSVASIVPLFYNEGVEQIKETVSIIHESADILYYKNGNPYIHDILTNNTDKCIIETEYCMLAYNEKGLPLKLHWNFLDSSEESSYKYLVQRKNKHFARSDRRLQWRLVTV